MGRYYLGFVLGLSLLFVPGCTFNVGGLEGDLPVISQDMAVSGLDMTGGPEDLAGADLVGVDLSMPDLVQVSSLSHVSAGFILAGAADLSNVTQIDTSALTVAGAVLAAGAFVRDLKTGAAVLRVGVWSVNKDIDVVGSAPLVVIANGVVSLGKTIRAHGRNQLAGPGGSAANTGTGAGPNGAPNVGAGDSGGAGGSFGTRGGSGGNTAGLNGPVSGPTYGTLLADFAGGSGGGNGGSSGSCDGTGTRGEGGGGGGVIQISSFGGIVVAGGGDINVGGGGGNGGCPDVASGGGGGGSGGLIFLEAPFIDVQGRLAANGGGGGAGASVSGTDGKSGDDGKLGAAVASGGGGSSGGGAGGAGAAGAAGAAIGAQPGGINENAGGGGGGQGRIWLRTRGTDPTTGSTTSISPAAMVDKNF